MKQISLILMVLQTKTVLCIYLFNLRFRPIKIITI
nr:MAG TPA: hypothetical protein [Caudoviricetes sp.]